MAKLPEHLRPPFNEIVEKLNARISQKFRSLFIFDIQNDCSCDIEKYDVIDQESSALVISKNGIEKLDSSLIHLPMMPEISDKDIWSLLEKAIEYAPDRQLNHDIWLNRMLYNPSSDMEAVCKEFKKVAKHDIWLNKDGTIFGFWPADFVPKDFVYFIPEPDFFGVISAVIDKYGAFCMPKQMLKRML